MARIIDPDDDGGGLDLTDLDCPKCGCNSVEVLAYPRGNAPRLAGGRWSGSWFGSTSGRAKCRHCGVVFSIAIENADEDS